MDLGTLLDPSKITLPGMLLWVVYAFVTEKIVTGRHHRREIKAREDACARETVNLHEENARLLRDRNDAMDELRAQTTINERIRQLTTERRR